MANSVRTGPTHFVAAGSPRRCNRGRAEHDGSVANDAFDAVIALLVVGLLGLVLRWVFRPSRPRTGPLVDASDARELGLLTVIATALPQEDAMRQRARLGEAGIRSSMSRRRDGGHDLLVFSGDVAAARAVLLL